MQTDFQGFLVRSRAGLRLGPRTALGDRTLQACHRFKPVLTLQHFPDTSFVLCALKTSHCPLCSCHPEASSQTSSGSPGLFPEVCQHQVPLPPGTGGSQVSPGDPEDPLLFSPHLTKFLGIGVGLPCPPALLSSMGSQPLASIEPLNPAEWVRQKRCGEVRRYLCRGGAA